MIRKRIWLMIGIIAMIVGAWLLLPAVGIELPEFRPLATLPSGRKTGIRVRASKIDPLAMVRPGSWAEWSVSLENTGTADWDTSWLIVRIPKPGSVLIIRNCEACPAECTYCGWTGTCIRGYDEFLAEKCTIGAYVYCDHKECREDICGVWKLTYDTTTATCTDYVGYVDMGPIPAGGSKTIRLKLQVPSTVTQSYILLIGARAGVEGVYIVAEDTETIDIFGANLVIAFIGLLSLFGGLGSIIYSLR